MKKFDWVSYLLAGLMIAVYYIGEATELLFIAMLIILPLAYLLFGRLFPEKPDDQG